jgi:uncharacterized protein YdiU (UPF0061 family)
MSFLGLTIDYGPYGWVDDFDPGWTPNTTDAEQRRYRFGNQPGIGMWNIERLAIALMPLLGDDERKLEAAMHEYQRAYELAASERFSAKLGLTAKESTVELVHGLFSWLASEETDMTIFFRGLSSVVSGPEPTTFPDGLRAAFYGTPSEPQVRAGLAWLQRWWRATREESAAPAVLAQRMNLVNPKFVLRNYLSQQAIDAAHAGDASQVSKLLDVMRRPFDEQPGHEAFAEKRPEWARSKPGCSALSCSS